MVPLRVNIKIPEIINTLINIFLLRRINGKQNLS